MGKFSGKLATSEFVVTTELNPPKGTDLSDLLRKAEFLADYVDAFNLTDSHSSKMSLSPIAVAIRRFKAQVVVQVIWHNARRARKKVVFYQLSCALA